MSALSTSATACPRCGREGIRSQDEAFCLEHGTYDTPRLATDMAGDAPPLDLSAGRERRRRPTHKALPWTDEERREWETWREGDPLPEWAKGANAMADLEVTTATDLGRTAAESLKTLAQTARALERKREQLREEARPLLEIVKFAGVEVELRVLKDLGLRLPARKRGPVSESERWTCPGCSWKSKGRHPGQHMHSCEKYRAWKEGQA